MKIAVLSDTHGMHRRVDVPEADVLIHCGDLTRHGRYEEAADFIRWLDEQPHQHKLFTPGNHDACFAKQILGVREYLGKFENIHLLIDESFVIDGVKFYGSPWTPTFFDWHFMKDRGSPIREVWARIPSDVDVLFTHGPPYGHGDLAPAYRTANPKVAGCMDLLLRVHQIQPRFHIFGHIHDGYGKTDSDAFVRTTFVNASVCTERYQPTNAAQVLTY